MYFGVRCTSIPIDRDDSPEVLIALQYLLVVVLHMLDEAPILAQYGSMGRVCFYSFLVGNAGGLRIAGRCGSEVGYGSDQYQLTQHVLQV